MFTKRQRYFRSVSSVDIVSTFSFVSIVSIVNNVDIVIVAFKNWLDWFGLDLHNKNSLKQLSPLALIRESSKLGGKWITEPS